MNASTNTVADLLNSNDPDAAFLAAFRATTLETTLGEFQTLDRVCRLLIERRIRSMIENYAATEKTAFSQLLETDLGCDLSEAGELIEHSISVLQSEADHAVFLAECKSCGF